MKFKNFTFDVRIIISTLIFFILFYFPVFHHLDRLPILVWDESLFSLRALYMHLTGEYLHNFNLFEGMPNHANTKLPFTTFFQVMALKIGGINELSIRLPIVLIFTATVIYMIYHFKTRFNYIWSGFVFGLVAITSVGFVEPHMLRTGDQDAPFACYMILSAIAFLKYLETRKTKPLIGFTIFSLAAVLTKNLMAGLLAPGILLFALLTHQLLSILKDYKFWLACITIIGVYCGVILYYEMQYPGFFERMWSYELIGRYTTTIENHGKPILYYLKYLATKQFAPYLLLLPIVFSIAFVENVCKKLRNSILCISCVLFCYLLIISFSKTQTNWYIAPIYLFGAYLIALGSIPLFKYLNEQTKLYRNVFITGLLFSWLVLYLNVVTINFSTKTENKDEKYGLFMKILAKENPSLKKYTLVDNNFGTSAGFYKEMYNRNGLGYEINYKRDVNFDNNQIIMTCLNNILNPTNEKYNYEVIKQWQECKLLKINSRK